MWNSNELNANGEENAAMRNGASRALFDYWNRIRRGRFAPWRSEIEPADIHTLLPDVFIIESAEQSDFRFRLAGTRMCAAYRRELKGQDFMSLWSATDREGMETVMHNIARDGAVGVITLTCTSNREQHLRMEMVIMPLRHHDGEISRFIGVLSGTELPYWLGTNPVVSQSADSVRLLWPEDRNDEDRRAVNQSDTRVGEFFGRPARRVRHLAVYDGGLSD